MGRRGVVTSPNVLRRKSPSFNMFDSRDALPPEDPHDPGTQRTDRARDGGLFGSFVLFGSAIVTALVGAACLAAVAVWLSSPSTTEEVGFVLVGLALPLLLAGVLLFVELGVWARLTAVVGFAASLGGLAMFVAWFPGSWSTALTTPNGYAVGQYAAGVLLMVCAGVASGALRIAEAGAEARRAIERYDAEVAQRAADDVEGAGLDGYTWGGVPRDRSGATLTLREDPAWLEDVGRQRGDRVYVEATDRVDVAVEALMALQGGHRPRRFEAPVSAQASSLSSVRDSEAARSRRKRPWWRKVLGPLG